MFLWGHFVLTFYIPFPLLLSSLSSTTLHNTYVVHFGFPKSLIHNPCLGTALSLSIYSSISNSLFVQTLPTMFIKILKSYGISHDSVSDWKYLLLQTWNYSYTLPLMDCSLEMIVESLFQHCNRSVWNKKAKFQNRQFIIRKSYMWGFGLNHQ